ncbi:MAG: glycosyltransferase, partial [Vicinamibacterales bacterium]
MSEIPRRFHFIFGLRPQVEPFHLAYYLCLESCRQVNAPEALVLHFHHEPWGPWWERIKPHLTLSRVSPEPFVDQSPRYLDHVEGRFIRLLGLEYAHHADFLRLKLLIAEGGVYADIDSLFVRSLPAALYSEPFVIGEEDPVVVREGRPQTSLCNAVMMAKPGSAFASAWLARMYEVFDGTWSRHSCTEAARVQAGMPGEVHVVPSRYFYPFMWTRDGLADLFERQVPIDDDVLSVHLWNHLWWD